MASCEYCWWQKEAYRSPDDEIGYSTALAAAEREGWPCTKNTEEGARLRAGDFWDEATKRDTRLTPEPSDA